RGTHTRTIVSYLRKYTVSTKARNERNSVSLPLPHLLVIDSRPCSPSRARGTHTRTIVSYLRKYTVSTKARNERNSSAKNHTSNHLPCKLAIAASSTAQQRT
ncbi:unnamed protein product, partial [Ectocarpus sp. 6 AP-2014]